MDVQSIESARPWLGGRRYWQAAGAAILILLLAGATHLLWVTSRTALSQEAAVVCGWTATPGQPESVRVFMRDALTNAPLPQTDVDLELRSDDGTAVWREEDQLS